MENTLGLAFAIMGMMAAVSLGGMGSAIGIGISTTQATGVLSEKPELYGKLFVIMALPGTQGFYGFIEFFWIMTRLNLFSKIPQVSLSLGLQLFAIGLGMGLVQLISAIHQGKVSAGCINLVAEREEEAGRAIILPSLVEVYAVLALIASILITNIVTAGL